MGLVAMVAFLYRNGLELTATNAGVLSWILAVASGETTESELADRIEAHLRPDDP